MNHSVNGGDLGGYITFDDVDFINPNRSLLPAQGAKLFALGRHCLEAACRSIRPKRVHLPLYTCASVKRALSRCDIKVDYYSLKDTLIPDVSGAALDELLVVNNYFGLLGAVPAFRKWLNQPATTQLLIDNTQSLGTKNQFPGLLSFVSPRKFLPVTDGGILYDELASINCASLPDGMDVSWGRIGWLFRAIDDGGRNQSYSEYLQYRETVQHIEYSRMSAVTRYLLSIFDVPSLVERRNDNFMKLNKIFPMHPCFNGVGSLGEFSPIGYPAYVKDAKQAQKRLGEHRIYTVRYWPELHSEKGLNAIEHDLLEHLLILPINRPASEEQLLKLIDVLMAC